MIDLMNFTEVLKEGIKSAIPYPEKGMVEADELKHLERNRRHIRDIALGDINKMNNIKLYFDMGSEELEALFPHYHILEDSKVIHKSYRGTSTSKGSQANITDKSKRDYGALTIGKPSHKKPTANYYQEYRKNVRGSRSGLVMQTIEVVDKNGKRKTIKKETMITKSSTTYYNKHYHYIENNLDLYILDSLASSFGLKRLRTQQSDLVDSQYEFLLNQIL